MLTQEAKRQKRQRAKMLEWRLCEEQREWEDAQYLWQEDAAASSPTPSWGLERVRRWYFPSLVALLMLVSFGGWALWQRAQIGIAKVEHQIEADLVAEFWHDRKPQSTAELGAVGQLPPFTLPSELGESVVQAQVRDLGSNWAVVEVILQPSTGAPGYRQTRLYRAGERGWIHEKPTPAHWGAARQLESDFFIFHYRALDEDAVMHVAPQLDALYPELYESLFWRQPTSDKLTITVDPTHKRRMLDHSRSRESGIVVASPSATLAPVELAASDLLIQSLVIELHNRLSVNALAEHNLPNYWLRLHDALQLWFTWKYDLPLAIWREPLVQWFLDEPKGGARSKAFYSPDFVDELCLHHSLWMRAPLEISVPILCWPSPASEKKSTIWPYHKQALDLSLSTLLYAPTAVMDEFGIPPADHLQEPGPYAILLATLFEYVASKYGEDAVLKLWAAIPEHQRAETLIPAVFGVSLEELSAGWHAFLADEYQIAR